uniref:Uncharacterized protein n=1 Tax=Panagrolaimus sp. ES5 TaxID=591445 RepID=A0AC34GFZ4_9BILA
MPRPAARGRKRKIKEVEEEQHHREERELSEDIFDTTEKTNDESSNESKVDSDFDEDEADNDPEDVGEKELLSERRAQNSTNTDKARKKRERMMKELAT